jgi:hypothetical protein
MRTPLWDDQAFKIWVREGAKARGMPVHEVLKAAGVNKFYLNETSDGRSTNVVMNLAAVLQLSPAPLFGLPAQDLSYWKLIAKNLSRQERLNLAARLLAAQAAELVIIVSDQERCDPATLVELVLRELNRPFDSPNNSASTDQSAS